VTQKGEANQERATRCAIVTGGSRGIGAQAVRRLAQRGDDVAIIYHSDAAAAAALVGEVTNQGRVARSYRADMGDSAAVSDAIDSIRADFGRIDVLVNNAARFVVAPFESIERAGFDDLFHTNVLGPVTAIQACLPFLPDGGSIVNVISVLGLAPGEGNILYSATKAALRAVTQGLVGPLGRRGITINCVAPGVVMTDMMRGVAEGALARVASETPLGRMAHADDIAGLILFLASKDARWITGRTIVADGGRISF